MVRQLRSKYPGYREQIDKMVSGVTGSNPANALRAALFDEWRADASKSGSKADQEMKFVNAHLNYIPTDYFARIEAGNPYSFNEVRAAVASKERTAAEVSDTRARLGLQIDQGNAQKKTILTGYKSELTKTVNTVLSDTTTQVGKDYKSAMDMIRKAQRAIAEGNPIPATETEKIKGLAGNLITQVNIALDQIGAENWDGDPSHNYFSQLDPKDMSAAKQEALLPI